MNMKMLSMGPRLAVFCNLLKWSVGPSLPCGPALLLLLCSPSFAGDFRLDIHFASKHLMDTPGTLENFNERNVGFGLEYHLNNRYHLMGGQFDNSINNESFYLGGGRNIKAGYTQYFWKRYEFGGEIGIANGYEEFISEDGRIWEKQNDFSPMVGPYLRLGDTHALKLRAILNPETFKEFGLITAGYQYEF